MNGSQTGALIQRAPALAEEEDVKLSLPESTMFIVGSSGFLWALLYGAFNALIG